MSLELPLTTDRNGHIIEEGSLVKSYDFPHRAGTDRDVEACRIEGVVEGCVESEGCERYVIRVTRRIWNGAEITPESEFLHPPLNGILKSFGGVTDSVVVLDSPQPPTIDDALEGAYTALQVVATKSGRLALEDQEQVNRALSLVESYRDDLDAHLEAVCDARDVVDLGCREWDNAANVE